MIDIATLENEILQSKKPGHRFRLNSQGLARNDERLMRCLKSSKDKLIVSVDLAAAEPTIITHYTKDPIYAYAAFTGVGKKPYYDNGVLMIDDPYLLSASTWPIMGDLMKQAFTRDWGGKTFVDQWMEDNEVVKGVLKKEFRAVAKAGVLALGYGAGWRKLKQMFYENGFEITAHQAKGMYKTYWGLYEYIHAYAQYCQETVKKQGYIVNDFGYRLTPDPHKAFNAVIQSSASGVLDLLQINFFDICKHVNRRNDAKGLIHDELLFEIPKELEQECRQDMYKAVERLNNQLNWDIPIRIGWQSGDNHYVIH